MDLNSSETLVKCATLVDLLQTRAAVQPHQTAYIFLQDGETESDRLTYQDLDQRARAIAVQLQMLVAPGDRALLLFAPGLDYIAAFFGCLYAGVVAVPAYPPRPNRSLERLQTIVHDAQAAIALTTTSVLGSIERQFVKTPELQNLRWLTIDQITTLADHWQEPQLQEDTLAFLQYTSGSTAAPKGVMITHQNLLHNLGLIRQYVEYSPSSRGVIWLPPYHDMGLIGGILQPLYAGFPVILMSPLIFLQNPLRWLRAVSRYRATTSGGPNFAYDLSIRKITSEQLAELDLSAWDVAFNGAEPISAKTLDQFAAKFEPCGFRRSAFYPCYGMAEATLFISGARKATAPICKTVDAIALQQNQVILTQPEDPQSRTFVGCGQTPRDQQIAIVHPETFTRCADGKVGEIWVSGPSISQGYWQRPEETQATFGGKVAEFGDISFLRTGDLGFQADGELFITGRLKDVIIINGRNHYPQDLEWTIEQNTDAIRPSYCAAFSVDLEGEEKLVIAAEIERQVFGRDRLSSERNGAAADHSPGQEVIRTIRRAVSQHHDLQVYAVLLLKPGTMPKTSSGKIQRHACRLGFLENTLETIVQS